MTHPPGSLLEGICLWADRLTERPIALIDVPSAPVGGAVNDGRRRDTASGNPTFPSPFPHRQRALNMKFRPLYDRILVKRVEAEEKTAGGLIVPDSAKEKPREAEVIAVGAGRQTSDGSIRAVSLNVGDIVLFGKFTGDEIKLDGVEHIILREEDVLAVIEN